MFDKDDVGTPSRKVGSIQESSPSDSTTDGPSHSILDTSGPEIIVRTPSVSDSAAPPPVAANPTNDVILRQGSKLSNPRRSSWRQTPVISPDIVDMILKGDIFDSDDECGVNSVHSSKLETCLEVNEEENSTFKKYTPSTSRSSSRSGKHTTILKSSKPSSPENGRSVSKTSTSSLLEKKVSIDESTLTTVAAPDRRRRKFLSTGNRSYTLGDEAEMVEDMTASRDIVDHHGETGTISPLPDPMSISMDMRSFSLSRLRSNTLSHSSSTPDLTQIATMSKKQSKARRVERSNSKRQFGGVRGDSYLDRTGDNQSNTSPSRRSGTVTMSPKHSASSLSSRIKSSFSRWSERDHRTAEVRNKGSRTLK